MPKPETKTLILGKEPNTSTLWLKVVNSAKGPWMQLHIKHSHITARQYFRLNQLNEFIDLLDEAAEDMERRMQLQENHQDQQIIGRPVYIMTPTGKIKLGDTYRGEPASPNLPAPFPLDEAYERVSAIVDSAKKQKELK